MNNWAFCSPPKSSSRYPIINFGLNVTTTTTLWLYLTNFMGFSGHSNWRISDSKGSFPIVMDGNIETVATGIVILSQISWVNAISWYQICTWKYEKIIILRQYLDFRIELVLNTFLNISFSIKENTIVSKLFWSRILIRIRLRFCKLYPTGSNNQFWN